jgi:hypothetical protein
MNRTSWTPFCWFWSVVVSLPYHWNLSLVERRPARSRLPTTRKMELAMLYRTLLILLLALLAVVFVSASRADDPRSAVQSETVDISVSQVCSFALALRVRDASEEQVKKLMAPYRVIEIRKVYTNGISVQYLVRILYPWDKKGAKAKILREDQPRFDRGRQKARLLILSLKLLPEDRK